MKNGIRVKENEIVEKALEICIKAHEGQMRKGDVKPYYVHPLMTALKLAGLGAAPEVLAAALTHDVLEDTDFPKEKMREELNDRVTEMVEKLTQDDKLTWRGKKIRYIDEVKNASMDVKLICLADKVHNLESLIRGHELIGEEIWGLFRGSREDKEWFEDRLLEAIGDIQHPLMDEYRALIEEEKKLK